MESEMADQTSTVIDAVVRECLPDLKVVDVRVADGIGRDGDALYWITIVYDGPGPDPRGRLGLSTQARERLEQLGDRTYPIFSFVTKADARRLASASR